jgi:predicted lysophospholipase L1 biosynthesis ABC-type transport system permease subunit
MTRRLSLWRLALVRLRRRRGASLALGCGLAAAVMLVTVVPLIQSVTSQVGLQLVLRDLGDQRFLLMTQKDVRDETQYGAFQAMVRDRVAKTLGALITPRARYITSDDFYQRTLNGQSIVVEGGDRNPHLAAYEGLDRHVELLEGAFPTEARSQDAWWVTISDQTVASLYLKLGDRYCMTVFSEADQAWCARVAAIWRARDRFDPFWGGLGTANAALVTGSDAFFQIVGRLPGARVNAFAIYEPDRAAFRQDQAQGILDRLTQLRSFFNVRRTDAALISGLDRAIGDFLRRLQLAQFTIQLVAAQLLLIALFFLSFAAAHVLEQQRQLFAVWRSRGWSWRRTWRLVMLEFTLLAVLSAPAGVLLAWLATTTVARVIYGRDSPALIRVDPTRLALPIGAALALGLAVLAGQAFLASRRGLLEARRRASRPALRAWWQWRYLDLILLGLALPLLAEVRLRGGSELREVLGTRASDPVSLLLPGVAVTLAGLAGLRLLPLLVGALGLRRRRLAGLLASWQLARQPIQHARLALLLTFAVAVGLFAGIYGATERRNAVDRVAYASGADVRATYSFSQQPAAGPRLDQTVQQIPGVAASSLVVRTTGEPGTSGRVTVLAVDPTTFPKVAWTRPGLSQESLPALMHKLAVEGKAGMPLPGEPQRLGLWVYSSGIAAELSAPLVDDAGHRCACVLGRLDFSGWKYLEVPVSLGAALQYPARLQELALRYTGTGASAGTVGLSDLGVVIPGSEQPLIVEAFLQPVGWARLAANSALTEGELRSDSSVRRDGFPSANFYVETRFGKIAVAPPRVDQPVAALAPARTLRRLGLGLHERFPLRITSETVPVTIVALADHFPTLYPEEGDYLVVARDPLLATLGLLGSGQAWPNEAWLKVSGPAAHAAADRLRRTPRLEAVYDRGVLESVVLLDPLRLGLQAMLLIGFAGALALAAGGFALHFFLATRGRLSEYAILQANGLPTGVIERSLRLEQGVILAFTLVAGSAIGVLLAWTLLPALQLGSTLQDTVPETITTVEGTVVAAALLPVAMAAAAVGWFASRFGRRFHLMDELRMLG